MIFFSSDLHLYHKAILSSRPYYSIEEMNETLIDNHNELVDHTDTVYWLGDFGLNVGKNQLIRDLNRFKGQKHLIIGNHDDAKQLKTMIGLSNIRSVNDVLELNINNKSIFLSHYPHRSWKGSLSCTYHLFGHGHSKIMPLGLSFDVGVDCWNYSPISFETVEATMDKLMGTKAKGDKWNGVDFLEGE
jgi:calcineurin-like phosphoesterase family protein